MVWALDSQSRHRARVRVSAVPLSCNDSWQSVCTRVPLSPSSRPIIWYCPKGGDALDVWKVAAGLALITGSRRQVYD